MQQKAKGKIQKLDTGIEEKTRMFNEYVTDIVLYKPDESWVLVIVHFVDGGERWGTIKNERYKKSELRQDDLFDKVKYTGWLVNNDSHRFHYDKERRLFSELKYGKAIGEYSFAAFNELVKDKGMFGEFAPYDFK